MSDRYSTPSIDKTGFNCPHCHVRAVQHWHNVFANALKKGALPNRTSVKIVQDFEKRAENGEEGAEQIAKLARRLLSNDVFLASDNSDIYAYKLYKVEVAQCDHCSEVSVWISDRLVYPPAGAVEAHEDLPASIKPVFLEASGILEISPRASAALSRLAIQEFCIFLECKSSNLNDQIGELVSRGLNPDIAKMLDAVRVIGNNAVHPGEIDLKDDRETAEFLLRCINRICQRLITEKLEADKLFDMLPPGAKAAIEKRDKPKEPK